MPTSPTEPRPCGCPKGSQPRAVAQASPGQRQQRSSSDLSPLSGSRSPNPGGSSTCPERLKTIRLVCPLKNVVVCARANRIIPTRAKPHHGVVVCEDYMVNQWCSQKENCTKVHVIQEHTWNYITQVVDSDTGLYDPGFVIRCYDARMTRYYSIPSDSVSPTRGSSEYIKMHNDHGDNFKTKFLLCEDMINLGACERGAACEKVHTTLRDFSSVKSHVTHTTNPECLSSYPCVPADIIVRVFEQNNNGDYNDYSGECVLVTEGAKQYMSAYEVEREIPRKKMQHCAHFRTKGLCRMGENCRFIHVVNKQARSPTSSPPPVSRVDPPLSNTNFSVRGRYGANVVSGSATALQVAQKYSVENWDTSQGAPYDAFSGTDVAGGNLSCCKDDSVVSPHALDSSAVVVSGGDTWKQESPVVECYTKMRMISPTRRNNPYKKAGVGGGECGSDNR
ncbi:hypothetical protein TRVL_04499 [Trypanosoma vivax]|nr:hypothetical protein TRVL_04499 [Trypanosoma vivax]